MDILESYERIAQSIELLFAPQVEVVLHDLQRNRIQFIAGPKSTRKKGDPSHLSDADRSLPCGVIGPYKKVGDGGERQRSISTVLEGDDGTPSYMLCINFNIGELETALHVLSAHITKDQEGTLEEHFAENWQDQINSFIEEYLRQRSSSLRQLRRDEKRELVVALKKNGAFKGKHAAQYIADSLKISRASVYEYIKR